MYVNRYQGLGQQPICGVGSFNSETVLGIPPYIFIRQFWSSVKPENCGATTMSPPIISHAFVFLLTCPAVRVDAFTASVTLLNISSWNWDIHVVRVDWNKILKHLRSLVWFRNEEISSAGSLCTSFSESCSLTDKQEQTLWFKTFYVKIICESCHSCLFKHKDQI